MNNFNKALVLGSFLSLCCCQPTDNSIAFTPDSSYKLIIADHFEGNRLDTAFWKSYSNNPKPYDRIPPRSSCDFSNSEIFLDENIAVDNGLLKITAHKKNFRYAGITDGPCGSRHACNLIGCNSFDISVNYTSGSIFSRKGFNHGYFECRAKIPSPKGLYPVFWLWHHDEIVVFEFFGNSNSQFISLHNGAIYSTDSFTIKGDYSSAFHIYSVEWTPLYVTWYLDSQPINTEYKYFDKLTGKGIIESDSVSIDDYTINEAFPESKDRWMSVNLSLRIYEWSKEIQDNLLPTQFLIDYVKIYQK